MVESMEKIVNLCKARGYVYPGSEIYGGLANTWDYGPLGVELKNNVKNAWRKKFIQEQKNIVVDLLRKGDFATLRSLKQSDVSALTVVEYSSPKCRVVACQAFEYLELELRPVSDLALKVE